MRYLITIFASLIGFSSFAQGISYVEFKKLANTDINLQPEYGNVEKSKEQSKADDEFIKTVFQQDGSNQKGSEHLVRLGFDYLYRGDLVTAMKRFNQAFLLDNKNANSYWGFASVYFMFGDYTEALTQLDKGLVINPKSSNILTDKATIYTSYYAHDRKVGNLDMAIKLFNESYQIDPRNANTLFKLSVAYFYKGDCKNARLFLKEHNDAGGKAATKEYADALAKQCK